MITPEMWAFFMWLAWWINQLLQQLVIPEF